MDLGVVGFVLLRAFVGLAATNEEELNLELNDS
jgi:hypothetical protein